ncbi:MAG: sodium/proline symporter PutP [Oscillospiraceae bacterium]|nr:sodium/proline symporter PutP [Oscillospiraceae bacterium]MDY5735391.1 sodium/proline symporter PutP [Oscillospiraceae bacterium]
MFNLESIVFVVYLAFMLGIGVYFFVKSKDGGEKDYFLGGRQMGPWVSALSAGASDMSAWVLMGLPASIYAFGIGQAWVAIGLAIGYAVSWTVEAPRLRRFTIVANDAITVPQYLTNRFVSKSKALQIICAIIFLAAYTIYAASSMKACGTLFHTVIGIDATLAMYLAAAIIVGYTFLGGFSAVCWTDFFQGMLMLAALLIAPIFALIVIKGGGAAESVADLPANYWNLFSSWKDIVSGLGWGLGYFGMPHIIVRFMSVRSDKDLKKSAKIGITWNVLIVIFSVAAGCIGHLLLGEISDSSTVFIQMVRMLFPALISGVLLSAILAASMSTADSQLLASASAFASDVYKPVLRKGKASDKEMLWAGRFVVLAISVIAVLIASDPNSGTIMGLVENAWGLFGAAFGPAIMLSLFWKRFNFEGAIAGIVTGAVVDVLWLLCLSSTGIYEIIPGTIAGLIAAIIVSRCTKAPSEEVEKLFDKAVSYTE